MRSDLGSSAKSASTHMSVRSRVISESSANSRRSASGTHLRKLSMLTKSDKKQKEQELNNLKEMNQRLDEK